MKIGAQVTTSARPVKIALASSYPGRLIFALAHAQLNVARPETASSVIPYYRTETNTNTNRQNPPLAVPSRRATQT